MSNESLIKQVSHLKSDELKHLILDLVSAWEAKIAQERNAPHEPSAVYAEIEEALESYEDSILQAIEYRLQNPDPAS